MPSNKFDWSRNKLLQLVDRKEDEEDSEDLDVPDEQEDDVEESKGNINQNF